MRPQPPAEEPPEVVAKRLEASLKTAANALNLFAASLRTGGFVRAGPQYEQLHAVLAEQRLWAMSHKRAELDPLWAEVAKNARDMHDILAPILRAMEGLRDIDRIQPLTLVDGPATDDAKPPSRKKARKKSSKAKGKNVPVREPRDDKT